MRSEERGGRARSVASLFWQTCDRFNLPWRLICRSKWILPSAAERLVYLWALGRKSTISRFTKMNELQIHVSRELFQTALILHQKNQAFKAFTEHLQGEMLFMVSLPYCAWPQQGQQKTLFGPHGFLHWPKHITGHHLPSHFYQVTWLMPQKSCQEERSLSHLKREKASSTMALLLRKQKRDEMMLEIRQTRKRWK